jgi:hypothetical protein
MAKMFDLKNTNDLPNCIKYGKNTLGFGDARASNLFDLNKLVSSACSKLFVKRLELHLL